MPRGNPDWIRKRQEREAAEAAQTHPDDLVAVGTERSRDLRECIHKDMVLQFGFGPSGWSAVVHHITDKGVYCRPSMHLEPDLSRCTFYSWDEIETQVTGVA